MKAAEDRFNLRGGSPRPVLFAGFLFALVGAIAVFLWRVTPVRPTPSARPVDEVRTLDRRLPAGDFCRVTLRGPIGPNGRFLCLSNLEASINEHVVHIPPECFTDLRDVEVGDGIAFAGTVEQSLLFLTGGRGTNLWQSKFTIRSNHVVERETRTETGTPVVTPYGPPLEIQYGIIPPAELERVRNETMSKPLK